MTVSASPTAPTARSPRAVLPLSPGSLTDRARGRVVDVRERTA